MQYQIGSTPDHAQDRYRGQPPYKKQVLPFLPPVYPTSLLQSYKSMECFTLLKFLINEVFNSFKDHPWVRRLKPI